MTTYTDHARKYSRNGREYQAVEPLQSTLDLIAKIRLDNAKREYLKREPQRLDAAVERLIERYEVLRTAPAPLPVDDSMSMHFVNGEVDYIEPGALIDNDTGELPY